MKKIVSVGLPLPDELVIKILCDVIKGGYVEGGSTEADLYTRVDALFELRTVSVQFNRCFNMIKTSFDFNCSNSSIQAHFVQLFFRRSFFLRSLDFESSAVHSASDKVRSLSDIFLDSSGSNVVPSLLGVEEINFQDFSFSTMGVIWAMDKSEDFLFLAKFPCLKTIILDDIEFDENEFRQIFSGRSGLKALELDSCNMSSTMMTYLISEATALVHLDLSHNDTFNDEALSTLKVARCLHTLVLVDTAISYSGLLDFLRSYKGLRFLSAFDCDRISKEQLNDLVNWARVYYVGLNIEL